MLLILVLILSFALRWNGINRPHRSTFDESLYQELGYQLYQDPGNYSPRPIYHNLVKMGRPPPEYLQQPLFKHPPLFSYFIALSLRLFGPTVKSASLVSVLFGCLTIWLIFLIGKQLYDRTIGIMAAVLLSLDPVHWLCSEKLWPGTTQTFFILLTLYFFYPGVGEEKPVSLGRCQPGAGSPDKIYQFPAFTGYLWLCFIVSKRLTPE
ncbi:MAG: glycosyltransferase family 39 protein [PVC group bacterium]